MRIRFCLLIMLFAGRYALAQDVIVKQDGGTILSKVLEIGTQEIAYKKWNSQDGPVYKIAKDQVLSVNYQNGEVDRFACPSDNPRPEEQPVVDVSPAEDNAMRIALYNNSIRSRKNETPGKFAARYTYKFGMSSNSVLSSEDLDISIVLNGNGNGSWYNAPYLIKIRNKTDGFIYIDLANCFKIYPDGSYRCYYDTKQTTISSGTGSGVSLGLGAVANAFDIGGIAGTLANGLAVGTGSSKSASTTYAQNRILTVPPMATANLTEEKRDGRDGRGLITNSESFYIDAKDEWLPKRSVPKNGSISYSEKESPYTLKYVVVYSKDAQFSEIKRNTFELYVQQVLGVDIESTEINLYYRRDWEKKFLDMTPNTIIGIAIDNRNSHFL
ncbi:hypothetical protein [Alistipes communis]|uniref:hypothetical protein n=1 Tax=Alistipes communis TaxID=2585118 RepID=UPI003208BDEF